MFVVELDYLQTASLGAVMLIVGFFLVRKSYLLKKYCIPATVIGGLLFSFINLFLYESNISKVSFDSSLEQFFMMVFFCSIGFHASFKMLKSGGKLVFKLLLCITVIIIAQNIIGPIMAVMFGMDPLMGLCLGSIPLVGGHGTSIAYSEIFQSDFGLMDAQLVAVSAATFGLAISSIIGGPLANRLVKKNNLKPSTEDCILYAESHEVVDVDDSHYLRAFLMILICIGAGTYVVELTHMVGIFFPPYIGAMLVSMLVRNYYDYKGISIPIREISSLGTICLSMFLVMALMILELWDLLDVAGPIIVTLVIQTIFVAIYCYYVLYRVMGRDYDSAAYVTATCGFSLGSTPNAMANLDALFNKYGEAPIAYFVVPLVGTVFVDLVNSGILTIFINVLC